MIKRCVTNSWMEKWSNSLQSSAVTCLKGQFIQTWNFSHHLLTWTWMEGQQKFRSQQNISGASQRNSAARFSLTAEIKCETAPHSLFREIQGSQSPDIPTYFEKKVFFFYTFRLLSLCSSYRSEATVKISSFNWIWDLWASGGCN